MNGIYKQIKDKIEQADAVMIGAGAGLSTAAGFEYGGKTFLDNFAYMKEKYNVSDMYMAGFAPFEDEEEYWGYWAKMIYLERYKDGAKPLYKKLLEYFKDKNYFVLTTNVDHQFQLAGFNKQRLFYTQGDYGLFQSTDTKDRNTYDNEEMVMEMMKNTDPITHKIPTSLIPYTPYGKKMIPNLRCDDSFVEDKGWYEAQERYHKFRAKYMWGNIVYLELGVGYNTPGIIKYPFWKDTYENSRAFYICINKGDVSCPDEIKDRAICVDGDIGEVLKNL